MYNKKMITDQFNRIFKRIKHKFVRETSKLRLVSLGKIIEKLRELPDFPSSACTNSQYLDLTLLGCRETHTLLRDATRRDIRINPDKTYRFEPTLSSDKLLSLFNKYGSDKSNKHNYHELYGYLLSKSTKELRAILEIGLGTNNPDVPSNMGTGGHPGASLRAWKDFSPECQVFGADIDERILFTEERIQTFQLDQLSDESWGNFLKQVGDQKFDLIIDDGLHSPSANLNTIKFLINYVAVNGFLIIEDVAERSLPVWETFVDLSPTEWQVQIIKMRKAFVICIQPS
jgi:hypothetical protein